MFQSRGAGEVSYVAENNILLDVQRDIIEVFRLGAHLDLKETMRGEDTMCKMLECVDGAVCVARGKSRPRALCRVLIDGEKAADQDLT